jgi:Flp pilus assembly protein TadD
MPLVAEVQAPAVAEQADVTESAVGEAASADPPVETVLAPEAEIEFETTLTEALSDLAPDADEHVTMTQLTHPGELTADLTTDIPLSDSMTGDDDEGLERPGFDEPLPIAIEAEESPDSLDVAETPLGISNTGDAPVTEVNLTASPSDDESAEQLSVQGLASHAAYEVLRDTEQPVELTTQEAEAHADEPEHPARAPATKLDAAGDLQIEMDARNAHVWNELGNIYFNNGEFDDAVIAYSKSIELDRWFAWPYSNLALTYVQKNRFSEAILLYQRSIELFKEAKDQAISWNRLGNVYRRINDYEHAIAAYQRADELDPDNASLSQQSRFSLLGSYSMEQKPSYVS